MPFVNKVIDFNEFMEQLHQRLQREGNSEALMFFECFLQKQLPRGFKHRAVPGWAGGVNAGDFDVIYPMAANILFNSASENYSESNPDSYKEADAVSRIFCDMINELFQCSGDDGFDLLPIKSYVEMMADRGLVKLTPAPDGRTMVTLSEEGERLARKVEEEIRHNID